MAQAMREWRLQFRGEPRALDDTQVTKADMAANNLVLWAIRAATVCWRKLGQAANPLGRRGVHLAGKTYSRHVPALIYPNPLNPDRYVF